MPHLHRNLCLNIEVVLQLSASCSNKGQFAEILSTWTHLSFSSSLPFLQLGIASIGRTMEKPANLCSRSSVYVIPNPRSGVISPVCESMVSCKPEILVGMESHIGNIWANRFAEHWCPAVETKTASWGPKPPLNPNLVELEHLDSEKQDSSDRTLWPGWISEILVQLCRFVACCRCAVDPHGPLCFSAAGQ